MASIKMTRTLKKVEAKPSMAVLSAEDVKRYSFALTMREALYEPPKETTLEEKIANYLNADDGGCATAREMAKAFNITKTEVNQVLYSNKKFYNCGERGSAPLWSTTTEEEDSSNIKCYWCNSLGVDKKTKSGAWVHEDCE
jgi:hypothetical protein